MVYQKQRICSSPLKASSPIPRRGWSRLKLTCAISIYDLVLIYSFSANMCLGTITAPFVLAAFSRRVSRVTSCECCADTSWRNCLSLVENQVECLFGSSRNGKSCIDPRVPQGWRGLIGFSETTRQVLSNDMTSLVSSSYSVRKSVSYRIPIHKIWSRGLSCDRVQPPLPYTIAKRLHKEGW